MGVLGRYSHGLIGLGLGLVSIMSASTVAVSAEKIASAAQGIAIDQIPIPHQVHSRAQPVASGKSVLVEFDTAPFPYTGSIPTSQMPFLETAADGRRFRRGARGQTLWENETFNDKRVLLHVPTGFDARRPGLIVVFFHGHGANLSDDVFLRQQVPAQLAGMNAVLVAPQLAVNAADSSIGKLWQPGGFARFLGEAAKNLARVHGDQRTARSFASMPVVVVAYSGGYSAAAWSAHHGGIGKRLRGIVLLDALYGDIDKFESWIVRDPSRLFVSAYTSSTQRGNSELQRKLTDRRIGFQTSSDFVSGTGNLVFVPTGGGSMHRDFVTQAWSDYPVADILGRLNGYVRR